MADITKTVGNGHGAPDYATLTLWEAGEEGVDPGAGFTSIAECSGYLGSGANINGTFVRGAIIRGDVTWDGTNDSSLANIEQLTIAAGTGINVEDLRIFTNNQFVSALNYNADFILMDRVVFDNTTVGINAIDINGAFTNGHIRNFVARGGADSVMAGFNQGTNLTNGLVYGATDKGIEGSSSTPMVITNVLLFNNGGQDIDSAGGITVIDCATEDLTGTYTGYGSAELVNFATGDLRTKSTSFLATAGSPFIGAFLEAGGGGTVLTPTGIASTEAFGSPTVLNLNQVLGVTSITSLEAFGLVTIVGSQILQPSSISSLEALGAPLIISGAIILEPSSISSQEALGTPSLVYAQIVSVTGIDSEEAFGIAIVQDGIALVIPVNNRDTYQAIQEYLRSTNKFVSTQNNEVIMEWLRSEGVAEGAFNNMFNDYWESNGFTGAYNDRWKKWKGS